ncbi:hypothetical protein [Salinispira pacifica]
MKRIAATLVLLSLALTPLIAQTAGGPRSGQQGSRAPGSGPAAAAQGGLDQGALQRLSIRIATPEGRIAVLSAVTGIDEQKIREAEKIKADTDQELRADQAEIDIRKAQLTRVLLDTHPKMSEVEKYLHEGLDWEYKLRLAQIQRDLRIRSLLGDRDWSRYRGAVRLVDRLQSARFDQLSTDAQNGRLTPGERELMQRLRALAQRLDSQGR